MQKSKKPPPSPELPGEQKILSASQIAEMLSISERTLSNLIRDGIFIRPMMLGRTRRWRLCDVLVWIDQLATAANKSSEPEGTISGSPHARTRNATSPS